jgi:hypothetical protein
MKKEAWLLVFTLLTIQFACAQLTKIYLIPTLHDLHKTNRQYSYDSLRAIVSRIRPDVIAVEIRSEDINTDSAYLKRNYTCEMWMMKYWFPNASIQGIDWLGEDIEGKPIPYRYWQDQSKIKYLQRRLEIDTAFTAKLQNCKLYEEEHMKILQYNSLKNMLKSNDVIITKEYYDCLNGQLQGSDYEELTQFYDKRNNRMKQRLTSIVVTTPPDKTVVILTGADHFPYLLEHLRKLKVKVLQP